MEEGRFEAVAMTEGDAVKYPVGKPLEVSDGPQEWLPRGGGKEGEGRWGKDFVSHATVEKVETELQKV